MTTKRNPVTAVCWRCKRRRSVDFLAGKKQESGKTAWRCRAHSVCATKARKAKEKRARARAEAEK